MSKVYSVYDSKVGAFVKSPFFLRSDGEALRGWMDAVNDPQLEFLKHGSDYTLMCLGEYDDVTGKFTNEVTPRSLGMASEFIRGEEIPRSQEGLRTGEVIQKGQMSFLKESVQERA